jgi:hypothetical protein
MTSDPNVGTEARVLSGVIEASRILSAVGLQRWQLHRPRRWHFLRLQRRPPQPHCLFSQQRRMLTPPPFARKQQGLGAKLDEKSAMGPR